MPKVWFRWDVVTWVCVLHKYVIDVYLHRNAEEFGKSFPQDAGTLFPHYSIQIKGHHLVAVQAMVDDKCDMLLIAMIHQDFVVPRVSVHETEQLLAFMCVNHLINEWHRETVLWTSIIQQVIIHVAFPSLIGFETMIGFWNSDWIFFFENESDLNHPIHLVLECLDTLRDKRPSSLPLLTKKI